MSTNIPRSYFMLIPATFPYPLLDRQFLPIKTSLFRTVSPLLPVMEFCPMIVVSSFCSLSQTYLNLKGRVSVL